MGAKGAVEIIFRSELGNPERIENLTQEYSKTFANPFSASKRGYIDDVIMPHDTRRRVARALTMLKNKSLNNPRKKHGNIPL